MFRFFLANRSNLRRVPQVLFSSERKTKITCIMHSTKIKKKSWPSKIFRGTSIKFSKKFLNIQKLFWMAMVIQNILGRSKFLGVKIILGRPTKKTKKFWTSSNFSWTPVNFFKKSFRHPKNVLDAENIFGRPKSFENFRKRELDGHHCQ